MKIKDIYNYQSTQGEIKEFVAITGREALEKEVQDKLGEELFEQYNDLMIDNLDLHCEMAYTQGFKDGAALIKEIL